MNIGDEVQNISENSTFYGELGVIIWVNKNKQYGLGVIWEGAKRAYYYRKQDVRLITNNNTVMKIGDKVRIPFGSRAGEPAFVRDIKGTNIWLCLESNPGAQAVLFHLGDFDAQTILDHMNKNKDVTSPTKMWIVWRGDSTYTNDVHYSYSAALEELERIAKQHPGKKFGLMELVAEAEVTSVVKITKV